VTFGARMSHFSLIIVGNHSNKTAAFNTCEATKRSLSMLQCILIQVFLQDKELKLFIPGWSKPTANYKHIKYIPICQRFSLLSPTIC